LSTPDCVEGRQRSGSTLVRFPERGFQAGGAQGVWKRLYFSPAAASFSAFGVWQGPPKGARGAEPGVVDQDKQHFGPRTGADLEGRARRYATVAAALDDTHMQEGIARPIGKLYEAESLVGIVPFDYGLDRGARRRFKPLGARSRCGSETAPGVSKLSSSKPWRRVGRKSLSLLLT
jgi:hypothetical protein